ncbi:anthranilate phosphoribosyltransferase [Desertibacillus haloalkaliphilus]|uniref:anthranilate phosphoribosyltransferase n=1 Tax=Desertibacillus haloalkaliphilus TaxID=1328930 RepID=UPI001C27FD0E|nr:anthranilate phosphoribosyltransferase [Desertibacillus haloalkaliphilus]MBU8907802.1 anthranilate phosphoribosyltransferase [Desertibacillus haloalkaliphilus]
MKQWIREVGRGQKGRRDLSYEEAMQAADAIASGEATDAQIGAFLIAERVKEESAEELSAFIQQFRQGSDRIPTSTVLQDKLVDFAGPYAGRNTFAATVPVSILLAERGIPALLHGSESLPPKYGTSIKRIVEKLDIPVDVTTNQVAKSIEEAMIGFAWTEKFSSPLARIRHIREEMGVRTFLNTAEKLLNLANAKTLMVGAFHKTAIDKIIPALQKLPYKQAYIVQGIEGSEDIPVHRNSSFIYKITDDGSESLTVKPKDFGLAQTKDQEKEKLSLDQQVDIINRLLAGDQAEELEYFRAQVLFNAGVRYFLYGEFATIEEGIRYADQQLVNKVGENHLQIWRRAINNSVKS